MEASIQISTIDRKWPARHAYSHWLICILQMLTLVWFIFDSSRWFLNGVAISTDTFGNPVNGLKVL